MPPIVLAIIDRWIGRWTKSMPQPLGRAAVVITGGSSGLGLALAQTFYSEGEIVVLVARNGQELAEAQTRFGSASSGRVFGLPLDVSAVDAPQKIADALNDLGLYLDILVNCAATGLSGPFASQPSDGVDALVALNVAALTRLTRFALPGMLARARGGILNVASLGGYVPGPQQAAYYASKAYVCSLTESIAAEVCGRGVRVTVVAPGPIETRFHARMGSEDALYRQLIPALSSQRAARSAVFGYRLGRSVVVPGLIPKALCVAVTLLPHWLTLPVLQVLLRPKASLKSCPQQNVIEN